MNLNNRLRTYHSDLMNIEDKYRKLIEKHNDRSLTGRAKSYFFKANKVKEQIKELSDEVEKVKNRFLVSSSLDSKFSFCGRANAKSVPRTHRRASAANQNGRLSDHHCIC